MWPDYLGATLLTLGVIVLLKVFGVIGRARATLDISREAFRVLSDSELSDDEKERTAQSSSGKLFVQLVLITAGAAAALAAPTLGVWALDAAGLVSLDGVVRVASSWPFIVAVVVVVTAGLWLRRATSS